MRYSIEPKHGKSLSNKYGEELLDSAKKLQ